MTRHDPFAEPRALVLDLDGLLIDTEGACFQTARALLTRHGAPGASFTASDYSPLVGRPITESYAGLRERFGLAAGVGELVSERNEHIMRWYRAPELLPGADELVRAAHAAGVPLAIASAAPGPLVDAAVAALPIGSLFTAVVSADHPRVGAPKPAPDVYVVACGILGVSPSELVAVEDSPSGAAAALAAGLATIVVPNEWTREQSFPTEAIHRDSLIDVLAELWPATV